MRTLDFAPLYRSTVGFDHLSQLLDSIVQREQSQPSYPPYNIERLDKDQYRITMAVAGFTEDELSIQSEQQTLKVTGKKQADDKSRTYLHQGIAARNFERVFPTRRSCESDCRANGKWPAAHRTGTRSTRSHEAPANPDWTR